MGVPLPISLSAFVDEIRKNRPRVNKNPPGMILMGKLNTVGRNSHRSKTNLGMMNSRVGKKKKKTNTGSPLTTNRLLWEGGFFDATTSLSTSFMF